MSVSYKKLWKLLIDKDMNKTELRLAIGASTATMAKLSNDDDVSMDTLARICTILQCNVGDIMDFIDERKPNPYNRSDFGGRNKMRNMIDANLRKN